jgi:large subunit ribosomal protein L23
MALFGNKKKKDEAKKPAKAVKPKAEAPAKKAAKPTSPAVMTPGSVLVRPRITEKTGNLTAANVYTFDVAMAATKRTVAAAVEAEYKVKPLKVRIVNQKAARVRLRTRRGYGATTRGKKAYVTVKKGDRIEFAS